MSSVLFSLIELRDLLSAHVLFTLGTMLLCGYAFGRICGKLRLPEITGFIIAGIIVSPAALGLIPHHLTPSLGVVTEVALGLIALTIGSEFSWAKLRRLGKEIVIIVAVQLVLVFVVVTTAMVVVGLALPYALLLGSIATASSPAVIVAVVQNLRAYGRFIDYLYGVVALLDAGTVILFGISFSLASGMLGLNPAGSSSTDLLFIALSEVVLSLLGGAVIGCILHWSLRNRRRTSELVLITLGVVFAGTAVSIVFHLSPLLVNMTAGAVLINLTPRHHRVFRSLEPLTPPLYALFFVLAGAELRLGILMQPNILLLGGTYVVFRNLAKTVGTQLGATISKTPEPIRSNLGLTMFPQAGVALGLVLMIQAPPVAELMTIEQRSFVEILVNIVLLSVFVNQLFGPPLAKRAVIRGNEMEE